MRIATKRGGPERRDFSENLSISCIRQRHRFRQAIVLLILFGAAPPAMSADTIIDNTSSSTSRTGTWDASGASGYYLTGSVWSRDGATFTWNFACSQTGQYEVSMWWTAWPSRSTSIPVSIQSASGSTTVYIDQTVNGGRWNLLGSYQFTAGNTYKVVITAQPDPTSTCADAVKFSPVTSSSGSNIIDNSDSVNTSRTGTWQVSSAPGYYATGSVWSRDGATFTWNLSPQQSGQYDISMWWTEWPSRGSNIPVDIQSAAGTTRVYINQISNGGKWNSLGTYTLNAGTTYKVIETASPDPASTCADAVRFTLVGSTSGPVAQIISISPNPASVGSTVTLKGSGSSSNATITAYSWRSSIEGALGTGSTITFVPRSSGTRTIYLKVQDSKGAWSSETSANLDVGTENIYISFAYNDDDPSYQMNSMLQNLGATRTSDGWAYTNSTTKRSFRMHWAHSNDLLKQALKTEGAHIIIEAHSNYGLGPVFASSTEISSQTVRGVRYIDDARVLNISTPWVAIDVGDFITAQAFPDWWPKFSDGSSGIMPYTFGSTRGDPPYNYYLTYQVPGNSTWYKVDPANNSPLQRFPDSGKPAWYSATGAKPNPSNPDHVKYFITNSASWTKYYPKPHYLAKTIIFRNSPDVQQSELKYSRLMYNSCGSGYYFAGFLNRGIMFFTMGTQASGDNSVVYLRNYLLGKSDYEIWRTLQNIEPVYDYYDFSKLPPSMTVSTTAQPVAMTAEASPSDNVSIQKVNSLNGLTVDATIAKLEGPDFFGNDALTDMAVWVQLGPRKDEAITKALDLLKLPAMEVKDGYAIGYRMKEHHVAQMVLRAFGESPARIAAAYSPADAFTRGNLIRASGGFARNDSVRPILIAALDDVAFCEPATSETIGWPMRLCDVAYNQLVMNLGIQDVLRNIGTGLPIDQRDSNIAILKQRLGVQ
jgi:hypothetical protein